MSDIHWIFSCFLSSRVERKRWRGEREGARETQSEQTKERMNERESEKRKSEWGGRALTNQNKCMKYSIKWIYNDDHN